MSDYDESKEISERIASLIESPAHLTNTILEITFACWEESDQSVDTYISLLGAIEAAKQFLSTHLGDVLNDDE